MVSFGGSFRSSRFGKKTINRSNLRGNGSRIGNGVSRFGGNDSNNSGASCSSDSSGASQKNNDEINGYRQNTPWGKSVGSSGWGATFNKAIFGDRKSRRLRKEEMQNVKVDKTKINRAWRDGKLSKELLGAEIKVDRRVKPGDVKYNYRKNTISISETDGLKKRELPEQIIKLAQSSGRFRKTTGIDVVTDQKKRMIKNMFRHKDSAIDRANKRMQASSIKKASSKSSRRKIELGSLVNKKYKS